MITVQRRIYTSNMKDLLCLTQQSHHLQGESKHFTPSPKVSGSISPVTEYSEIKFYTLLLHVHIYTKLFFLHFIQLSLTMTTLCHIKHGQLENFYISPEKNMKN